MIATKSVFEEEIREQVVYTDDDKDDTHLTRPKPVAPVEIS